MKSYVINLDSRPDRLIDFQKNKFPFEVERIPGVVASCGEDGCTYSHLQILEKQKEYPFIVFEDDCEMIESWDVVEKAIKQLPPDWDGLWLGVNPQNHLVRYSANLFYLKQAYTAHAIMYGSKRMVDYILKNHNTPSGKNLDIFYCHVLQHQFNCFVTYPLVATQKPGLNDISETYVDYSKEIIEGYKKFIKKEQKHEVFR